MKNKSRRYWGYLRKRERERERKRKKEREREREREELIDTSQGQTNDLFFCKNEIDRTIIYNNVHIFLPLLLLLLLLLGTI